MDGAVKTVVDTLKNRAIELYAGKRLQAEDVAFVMELLEVIISTLLGEEQS